jgi:hypothetical protein
MNEVTRELKEVVEHLADQGVLTPSDTKAIFHVLEHVQDVPSPQAPQAPQALSGPYWDARHKALHDRKVHP